MTCGRMYAHPGHEFVAGPAADVDQWCDGVEPARSLSRLLEVRPDLAGLGVGATRHELTVASA